MKTFNEIELYNVGQWNRATIADGTYLSGTTLFPLSENDNILLSAVDTYKGNSIETAETNHERAVVLGTYSSKWKTDLTDGIYPRIQQYNDAADIILEDYGPDWIETAEDVEEKGPSWDAMISSAESGYAASAYLTDPGINIADILHSAFFYCADGKQNWYNGPADLDAVKNYSLYQGVYDAENEKEISTNYSFCIGLDGSIKGSNVPPAANDHTFALLGAGAGHTFQIKDSTNFGKDISVGCYTIGNNCSGIYFGTCTVKGNANSIVHSINTSSGCNHSLILSPYFHDIDNVVAIKGQLAGHTPAKNELFIGDLPGTNYNKNAVVFAWSHPDNTGNIYSVENTFIQNGGSYLKNVLAPGGHINSIENGLCAGREYFARSKAITVGTHVGAGKQYQIGVGYNFSQVGENSLSVSDYHLTSANNSINVSEKGYLNGDNILGVCDENGFAEPTASNDTVMARQCYTRCINDSFVNTYSASVNNAKKSLVHGEHYENSTFDKSLVLGVKGIGEATNSVFYSNCYMPTVTFEEGETELKRRVAYSHDIENCIVMNKFSFAPSTIYDKPNSFANNDSFKYTTTKRSNSIAITSGCEVITTRDYLDFLVGDNDRGYHTTMSSPNTSFGADTESSQLWAKHNFYVGKFIRRTYINGMIPDWNKLYDWSKSYSVSVGNVSAFNTFSSEHLNCDAQQVKVGNYNNYAYLSPCGSTEDPFSPFRHQLAVGDKNEFLLVPGSQGVVIGKNNKILVPYYPYSGLTPTSIPGTMLCIGVNCNTDKIMPNEIYIDGKQNQCYDRTDSTTKDAYDANYPLTKLLLGIKGVATSDTAATARAAYFLSGSNIILSKDDGPYCVITTTTSTNVQSSNRNGVYFRKNDNKWYDVKTGDCITD